MANFDVINLTWTADWEEILSSLPGRMQDIFYTPNYYKLFQIKDGGTPQCFIFKNDSKLAVYPFLRNSIKHLGFNLDREYFDIQGAYGYNGVVYNSNEKAFIQDFRNSFNQWCAKENIIAEFTRFHPIIQNDIFYKPDMQVIMDRETVVLGLNQDYEVIWQNEYSSRNRNMIRKALKMGFRSEIITQPNDSEIYRFFDIYKENMQRVDADTYYYFDFTYFRQLFDLFHKNAYLIHIKNEQSNLLASSVFLHWGNYYHYHLSGRRAESDNSVNNYLLDRAIQHAKKIGASWFYLGGGTSSSMADTLLKFKKNFSKQTLPFYIGKKIHNPEIYNNIIEQWENQKPHKKELLGKKLLRYRE